MATTGCEESIGPPYNTKYGLFLMFLCKSYEEISPQKCKHSIVAIESLPRYPFMEIHGENISLDEITSDFFCALCATLAFYFMRQHYGRHVWHNFVFFSYTSRMGFFVLKCTHAEMVTCGIATWLEWTVQKEATRTLHFCIYPVEI